MQSVSLRVFSLLRQWLAIDFHLSSAGTLGNIQEAFDEVVAGQHPAVDAHLVAKASQPDEAVDLVEPEAADGQVEYRRVMQVMDVLKTQGAAKVGLLVKPSP